MATVEELIVKFTGDASGMDKAASKAKLDLKSVEKEVLTLNRVLERAKASGAKDDVLDYNMKALEGKIGQYLKVRDKVRREDERAAKSNGSGGIVGGFAIGAGLGAIQTALALFEKIAVPQFTKAFEQITGLEDAQRAYNKEIERGNVLERDRARALSNVERANSRLAQTMWTTTGETDTDRQAEFWRERESGTTRDIEAALREKERLERDEIAKDTYGRLLPFVGRGQQMEFELAQKEKERNDARIEQLKKKRDDEMNAAREIEAQGTRMDRMGRSAGFDEQKLKNQLELIGKLGDKRKLILREQLLDDNILGKAAWTEEDVKKVDELVEKMERVKQLREDISMRERLDEMEKNRAGRGFTGVEREVLIREAQGKTLGNRELLEQADMDAGDALKEKFMDPYKKAGKEIDRLNRLHRQGNIDAQTYAKALEEVARQTDNMGRASERAGVEVGSAESMARIDEYVRIQQQPQALANQIDRAMSQPPTGSGDSEMSKQTAILEGIRRNTAKPNGVPMVPANLGGG